ncbi:MAG: isoprenylcysteine carboxylmethyltransferase family protein [Phycisphaerales bacterium]|nr:isoprenylcysteine carboxylmethyltransferase family protein [Phycisphaerales bacterium]
MADGIIGALAIPDMILFVFGSLFTGLACAIRWKIGKGLLWMLSGAVVYATLLCFGFHIQFGGYLPPTLVMFASSVCTVFIACTSRPDDPIYPVIRFREFHARNPFQAFKRTLFQIVVFWSVFLLLLPTAIAYIERGIGIRGFEGFSGLGIVIFLLASCLGLSSAWAMSSYGQGTPLPTEAAPMLVSRGPYRFVRNPMVIGGLMQGIGVMLFTGSWLMLPYILLGGIYWQFCVCPVEEQDLLMRFGDEYESYQKRVRCWIPRFHRVAMSLGES